MNELAQARERTGASSADRQIALRYADRFSNAAANASGAAQNAGLGTPVSAIASQVYDGWLEHSIGGKIVGARTKRLPMRRPRNVASKATTLRRERRSSWRPMTMPPLT